MQTIVNLEDLNQSDISLAGGKAANLGELLHAGMPVPPGFCITTMAYHQYLEVNHLTVLIRQQLAQLNGANVADLERVSASIREAFAAGQIPVELTHEITSAYRRMCHSAPAAVAVRSSATAEDLPDLSFAGQQDTFLNIIGEAALLEAVVRCWSSLWTPRAIGYRMRNGIDQQDIALAVVVQQMVASHTAGVMFTANPLTGRRTETVIDAAFGLGETVVSGLVEPDQYIVDTLSEENGFAILSKKLGSKTTSVRGCTEGGTRTSAEQKSDTQALTDEQILALAQAGKQTEAYFGHPQDIE
ncbi:MAG: PEP/pyruvate-binding domain-containing protein, partial [Anaerolineaceae bacterium]